MGLSHVIVTALLCVTVIIVTFRLTAQPPKATKEPQTEDEDLMRSLMHFENDEVMLDSMALKEIIGQATRAAEPESVAAKAYQRISSEDSFSEHKVIEISMEDYDILVKTEPHLEDLVDVWTEYDGKIVARVSKETMLLYFPLHRIRVLLDDVQSLIDQETLRLASHAQAFRATDSIDTFFEEFRTYKETFTWYQALEKQYPEYLQLVPSIGQSVEGRDLFAVKIGDHAHADPERKSIFIHGLQHAREWISGSTVNYIAYKLLSILDAPDSEARQLLASVQVIIVPIMNPDGYEYTFTNNRLWRKNRARNVIGRGVDLNRNWGEHWNGPGTSQNPLSDIYSGPRAESEPEVKAMEAFFIKEGSACSSMYDRLVHKCSGKIIGAIDFHAYSQLIMWPYGYTRTPYTYENEHREMAKRLSNDIAEHGGKRYKAIPIRDLYLASGSSVDWYSSPKTVKALHGTVPYTVTIELRPSPSDPRGFVLPPSEIIPTGEEIFPAFLTFIQHCLDNPLAE